MGRLDSFWISLVLTLDSFGLFLVVLVCFDLFWISLGLILVVLAFSLVCSRSVYLSFWIVLACSRSF